MELKAAVADLVGRLRVESDGAGGWLGRTCEVGSPHVYGGQFLGQAVMAAGADGTPGDVHALHACFLRPGRKSEPVRYRVARSHDGASFARRRVRAFQGERLLFEADVSFQQPEAGRTHQNTAPTAPLPETLRNEGEAPAGWRLHGADAAMQRTSLWPMDVRPVPLADVAGPQAASRWWLRCAAALPDEPLLHAALLAYASDYAFLKPALQVQGLRFGQPDLHLASLDHALWLHRPPRADDWLLFASVSPNAGGGRCFARGEVHDARGNLVASVAQEGLMRLRGAA